MKCKCKRHFFGSLLTILLLPFVMLSCGGSSSDDGGGTVDATVQMQLATSSVAEDVGGGTHDVLVQLNTTATGTLASAVTVNVADLLTGSATAGGVDYTFATPTTVTFGVGSGNGDTQAATITLNNDTLVENNETVNLRLQNVGGPSTILGVSDDHQVTITDDEAAATTVQMQLAASSVAEDVGSGTHNVLVQLNTPGTLAVAVTVDVSDLGTGSATAGGVDYAFVTPTAVTFGVGSGNGVLRTVTITLNNDTLVENDETIDLQLQNVGGPATILVVSEDHQMTITDDEAATTTVQMQLAASSVAEDVGSGTHDVLVRLNTTATGTLAVGVTVDVVDLPTSSATAGGIDYAFVTPTTVTFGVGSGNGDTQAVTITLNNDTLVENNEIIDLELQNDSGPATILAVSDDHQVTITDDEAAATTVQMQLAASSVAEDVGGGTHDVLVQLNTTATGTLASAVTVNVVDLLTGSATTGGVDYTFATPTTVTFGVGSGNGDTQAATITLDNDTLVENNETVNLQLQNVSGPATILAGSEDHQVTITDDEAAATTVQMQLAASSVAEDVSGGTHDVLVQLNTTATGTLAVAVTVNVVDLLTGSATAGGIDYTFATPTTVTFGVGSGNGDTQAATITLNNDTLVENNEIIDLELQNDSGPATILAVSDAHQVTITDDEAAATTVQMQLAASSVAEDVGGGTHDVLVQLNTTGTLAVAVTVDVADSVTGSATAGGVDYAFATPTTVTFGVGSGNGDTQAATITLNNDTLVENNETVNLQLQNVSGPATILAGSEDHQVTITDDEAATVQFEQAASSELETAPSHTVTVQLNTTGTSTLAVAVTVNVVDLLTGDATAGGTDYTFDTPTTVTFTAGSGDGDTKTVNITFNDDPLVEVHETIELELQIVSGPATILAGTHQVTIIEPVPTVVFIADKDVAGTNELYAALYDGFSVVKLSGPMVLGQNVIDFKISPDGTRVAYRADQDTPGVIELYVNSINGGNLVKVTPDLAPAGDVEVPFALTYDAFNWSPDSSMIAYIADQENDGVYELFVSAPDGSSNLKVSGVMHTDLDGGDALEFEWAPDSSLIAYRADQDFNGVIELYASQPSVTSTFTKINIPIPDFDPRDVAAAPGSQADVFQWAPDSTRIAYIADQDSNDVFEVFTANLITAVPPAFDPPVQVSFEPLVSGGEVLEFSWAPNGTRIAYLADQDTNDVFELYTSEPDGANNVKVSVTPVAGGDVWDYEWAPDSSLVAYRAEQDTDNVVELYTSPSDTDVGNTKVSLDPLVPGGSVAPGFEWAPNSSSIAYIADQENDNIFEIFTAELTGIMPLVFDTPIKVHPDLTGNEDVQEFKWAPDSSRIAYIANQDTDTLFELCSSLPDGSVNDIVSGPLVVANGRVFEFKWAPDNSRIAYLAWQENDFVFELYSSLPDGRGNRNISGPLVSGGIVDSFEYEP